jgi:probable H4MPT-linked C1 transfer pathway protein
MIATGGVVFGWDVGGAHLKVSRVDGDGVLRDAAQWPCALWQGLAHLERGIEAVRARWPAAAAPEAIHAITMTGEMVDLFADREQGVLALTRLLAARLGPRTRFFAGECWLDADACAGQWRAVASVNWLATAHWIAQRLAVERRWQGGGQVGGQSGGEGDAVLIDIGSTTADIVPIRAGRVAATGYDDATRLASGELVYQGVVRTPLCALAQRMPFGNDSVNVMNEWFATSADVYRLTGELDPEYDQHPSADNGPKSVAASRARLARMIGRDARDAAPQAWRAFAQRWRDAQLHQLELNLARVDAASLRQRPLEARDDGVTERTDKRASRRATIVGAGCGRFLAAELARRGARPYRDFASLLDVPAGAAGWAATCAPSVAIALLAAHGKLREVSCG